MVVASTAVGMAATMVAKVPLAVFAAVEGYGGGSRYGRMGGQSMSARNSGAATSSSSLARADTSPGWHSFPGRSGGNSGAFQAAKWELPTVNGIPLAAPTVRQERRLRAPGSEEIAGSTMAPASVARAGAVEDGVAEVGEEEAGEDGAVAGVIPATDLAGDAGPAAGDLDLVGVLTGILFGRCIRILTGAIWGGVILTATMLRLTTFILIPLKAGRVAGARVV